MAATGPFEKFKVELAGPGVEPDSVDSARLLGFVAAYIDLLKKIGSEDGEQISFRGIAIENKCVAVTLTPNDSEVAKRLADASSIYLHGAKPPAGLKSLVEIAQAKLRDFPPEYTARVLIGSWERALAVPEAEGNANLPTSIETMRIVVERIGGASPRVRVRSVLDREVFGMDLTRKQARDLAPSLYLQIDATVRVLRTAEGRVIDGELLDFTSVRDEDPSKAIEEWFRPHADYWNKVKDVSEALGRRDRS